MVRASVSGISLLALSPNSYGGWVSTSSSCTCDTPTLPFSSLSVLEVFGCFLSFFNFAFRENKKMRKPMVAIPSGTPIPTPMVVGGLLDWSWW